MAWHDLRQNLRQENKLALLPLHVLLHNLELLTTETLDLTDLLKKRLESNPMYEIIAPSISYENLPEMGAPQSLEEKLLPQMAGCKTLRDKDDHFMRTLLLYLDSRGYLNREEREIADEMIIPEEELSHIMDDLRKNMEPPGLFSRDLRECLMIQLDRRGDISSDPYIVLRDCPQELEDGNLKGTSEKLDWSYERLKKALKGLSRLDPSPGNSETSYLAIPEIEFRPYLFPEVRLIDKNLPKIVLNRDLLAWDSDEIRRLVREGQKANDMLGRRYRTKLRIAMFICNRQKLFLASKTKAPCPLTMTEVAEELDMNVSTIQRTVISTSSISPAGHLSLSSFFSRPLKARPDMSVAMLREAIKEAVNSKKSDATLARELSIPARTITWHRSRL